MEISDLPNNKKIILFDGVCNLCNSSVQFVIKHDKNDIFRFVALQSELGKMIMTYLALNHHKLDSVIVFQKGIAYYSKSDSVIQIAKTLGGVFRFVIIFEIIPTIFRNHLYDLVAKNRYIWFGKQESCMVPTPLLESKFLI